MEISDITSITSMTSTQISKEDSNELGKQEFMQLLVEQLKYQDPLSPMDNQDYIAQLAQFSIVEGIDNLSASSYKSMAFSLMGKSVIAEATYNESGMLENITGTVDKIIYSGSDVLLGIGDNTVNLDDLLVISDGE